MKKMTQPKINKGFSNVKITGNLEFKKILQSDKDQSIYKSICGLYSYDKNPSLIEVSSALERILLKKHRVVYRLCLSFFKESDLKCTTFLARCRGENKSVRLRGRSLSIERICVMSCRKCSLMDLTLWLTQIAIERSSEMMGESSMDWLQETNVVKLAANVIDVNALRLHTIEWSMADIIATLSSLRTRLGALCSINLAMSLLCIESGFVMRNCKMCVTELAALQMALLLHLSENQRRLMRLLLQLVQRLEKSIDGGPLVQLTHWLSDWLLPSGPYQTQYPSCAFCLFLSMTYSAYRPNYTTLSSNINGSRTALLLPWLPFSTCYVSERER